MSSTVDVVAGIGVGVNENFTADNIKLASVSTFVLCMLGWLTVVMVGYLYMLRSLHSNNERKRISILFVLLSIVFPPCAMVPIVLNVH